MQVKTSSASRSTIRYPFPVVHGYDHERMMRLIEENWKLNRSAVNPDTDKFVAYLAGILDADILEVRSGEECLTWRIPEHWNVREGKLRRKDGTILADCRDNPLYLWTHSISYRGEISQETRVIV